MTYHARPDRADHELALGSTLARVLTVNDFHTPGTAGRRLVATATPGRVCESPTCSTRLSIYNQGTRCAPCQHRLDDWQRSVAAVRASLPARGVPTLPPARYDCAICGELLDPPRYDKHYCGARCRSHAQRDRRRT